MSEQFSIPTPGDIVAGKYHVVEELGRGAYGVVFRAEQHDIRRTVALKTLLPQAFLQADIVQRFQREAQLISRLDHPNVIKLYDYGVDEGLLYMAVEYVEGETLQDAMNADEPIALPRVKSIVGQILAALSHAHEAGIVHRDLKPENIVLLPVPQLDGSVLEVVKVLDFGISKLVQGEKDSGALKTLTQSGTVLGTPHYMSPENIIGDDVDHTTDLYAIGILLYEMLVGKHPFDAPSPNAVMVRHLRDDPPKLPPGLQNSTFGEAIERALIKQPLERIQSAEELAALVARGPDEIPDEVDTAHVIGESSGTPSSPMALAAAIAVIIAVLLVSIGWKLWLTSNELAEPGGADAAVAKVDSPASPDAGAPTDDASDDTERVDPLEVVEAVVDAGSIPEGLEFDVEDGLQLEQDDESTEEPSTNAGADDSKDDRRNDRDDKSKAPARVVFRIASDPVKASVSIDGRKVGLTPLEVEVDRADEPVEIRFSHVGYKNVTLDVVPSKDQKVSTKMDRDRLKFID